MRRIVRPIPLLLIAFGALGAAAPAGAQGTSSATPAVAGKASKLHFEVDGLAPPIAGRLPTALQLSTPSGFRLNVKALSKRCSEESGKLNECPAGSMMGKGSLLLGVTTPDGARDVTVPLTVYLHKPTKLLAVAFVFGWRVVPGTLSGSDGIVVGFDPLPAAPPFPGVSYTLKRITFNLGAKRVIKTRRVRRVNGKRRVTVTKRRVDLITNPPKCQGSWASSITLRFADGSEVPLASPTPCTSA
jgi:hypothetical protein